MKLKELLLAAAAAGGCKAHQRRAKIYGQDAWNGNGLRSGLGGCRRTGNMKQINKTKTKPVIFLGLGDLSEGGIPVRRKTPVACHRTCYPRLDCAQITNCHSTFDFCV